MYKFYEIPAEVLAKELHTGDRAPTLYQHRIMIIRKVFWSRLKKVVSLINRNCNNYGSCLDYAGGDGVLLPTLGTMFEKVYLADIEAEGAKRTVDYYSINNAEVISGNILEGILVDMKYDVIIAADVLEHFMELDAPIDIILKMLNKNGILVTSLPRENLLYVFLRFVFGVTKPEDHYHTAKEVEEVLKRKGFTQGHNVITKWDIFLEPLFSVKCWKLEQDD